MRTLILIPALNEADSLPSVVSELAEHAALSDILVVDDGSTDATARVLPGLGVRWLRLPQRLGTGAAVRTGLRFAASLGYQTVIRLDGDGQHPPEQIEAMLDPIRRGVADVAIGSRFAGGRTPSHSLARRLSQRALGGVLTMLTGGRVTDPTSGLWAFGPRALRLLVDHHPSGYPEPELRLFLSRNAMRLVEVPVTMRDRLAGQTSLTIGRTSAAVARLLLLLVVVPLRSAVGTPRD
jgi:glycosyltransferase involved in cell wall biosynthesis